MEKIKNKTGIDTISLTITNNEFIVDDTSKPVCLLSLYNIYNVPCITIGNMSDINVNCKDLEDLGVLTPVTKVEVSEMERKSSCIINNISDSYNTIDNSILESLKKIGHRQVIYIPNTNYIDNLEEDFDMYLLLNNASKSLIRGYVPVVITFTEKDLFIIYDFKTSNTKIVVGMDKDGIKGKVMHNVKNFGKDIISGEFIDKDGNSNNIADLTIEKIIMLSDDDMSLKKDTNEVKAIFNEKSLNNRVNILERTLVISDDAKGASEEILINPVQSKFVIPFNKLDNKIYMSNILKGRTYDKIRINANLNSEQFKTLVELVIPVFSNK